LEVKIKQEPVCAENLHVTSYNDSVKYYYVVKKQGEKKQCVCNLGGGSFLWKTSL